MKWIKWKSRHQSQRQDRWSRTLRSQKSEIEIIRKYKQNMWALWDTIKKTKPMKHQTRSTRQRHRKYILWKSKQKYFLICWERWSLRQNAFKISEGQDHERYSSYHIRGEARANWTKKECWKPKELVKSKGQHSRITTKFSLETLKARRHWDDLFRRE
jgi:hypothetical protein